MQDRNDSFNVVKIVGLFSLLFPAFALGAPQVPPSAPVTVVNTSANPVPVTATGSTTVTGTVNANVTNPADIAKALGFQQPVSFSLTFTAPRTFSAAYVVPANQRLIIEFASGNCDVQSASIANLLIDAQTASGEQRYSVNLPSLDSTGGAFAPILTGVFSHLVKIYAEAGTQVSIVAGRTGLVGADAFLQCNATLSGQLVNVP